MFDLIEDAKRRRLAGQPAPQAQVAPVISEPTPPAPVNPLAALQQTLANINTATAVPAEMVTAPTNVPAPVPTLDEQMAAIANAPVGAGAQIATGDEPHLAGVLDDMQHGEFPDQPLAMGEQAIDRMRAMLDYLNTHLASPAIAENLDTTLLFLRENPSLSDMLVPEDIQIFVRAMRASYGTVIKKKTANSAARSASKKRNEDAMADVDDLF